MQQLRHLFIQIKTTCVKTIHQRWTLTLNHAWMLVLVSPECAALQIGLVSKLTPSVVLVEVEWLAISFISQVTTISYHLCNNISMMPTLTSGWWWNSLPPSKWIRKTVNNFRWICVKLSLTCHLHWLTKWMNQKAIRWHFISRRVKAKHTKPTSQILKMSSQALHQLQLLQALSSQLCQTHACHSIPMLLKRNSTLSIITW